MRDTNDYEDDYEDDDDERERPRKKRKKKPKTDNVALVMSYAIGAGLVLLGVVLMVWFFNTTRAPSRMFNLLAAGGIASLLSGIGLIICPLDRERLDAFQNEGNLISVFKVMPLFWKIWMLVILAGMVGAFIYVAQNTVRVR
jgi:cell division septal protein FtsQ